MERPDFLVIGGTGLVGGALVRRAGSLVTAATAFTRDGMPGFRRLDAIDAAATHALVAELGPRVVVNAAVASRPEHPPAVVVDGAAHVARAAHAAGAALVHLSTDMVFDGASGPYDEDAPPSPITPYGAGKAAAESAVRAAHPRALIARLPLLYRIDPPDRGLSGWLEGCRAGRGYTLYVDELRCPAHVDDIADALVLLVRALTGDPTLPAPPPIVHLPGPRALSRHAFGLLVLEALGLPAAWAVAGRAADAVPPRPRELVLVARRTPLSYLTPLRPPEAALATPTPPTPPAAR